MNPEFLFSKASNVPFDYSSILAGVSAPEKFTVTPSAFSWDSDGSAAGYIVYRDGKFVKITSDNNF